MRNTKLPVHFSDKWVAEFTKALAVPTFKFTPISKPYEYIPHTYSPNDKQRNVTAKEQANLNYILNLTGGALTKGD